MKRVRSSSSSIRTGQWESQIAALFRPPELLPRIPGTVSTLHLLRHEIIETLIDVGPLGGDVVSERQAAEVAATAPHRLFASTMPICTAFDLLATIRYGDAGGIGTRFKRLLRQANPKRFDVLRARRMWALRNGLMHTFSLRPQKSGFDRKKKKKKKKKKKSVSESFSAMASWCD